MLQEIDHLDRGHRRIEPFVAGLCARALDRLLDGVGAGDALLAYATLSMLTTGSDCIATIIGCLAAACECERDGNIPISVEDVSQKLDSIERQAKFG